MTYRVGADIGGTKIKVIVVDEAGHLRGQATHPTRTTNPNAVVNSIRETISTALHAAGADLTQVSAIGAGIPGQVNPDTGDVRLAVNLNLQAYPLGRVLSDNLQTPVFLENDVAVGAIGAYQYVRQQENNLKHIVYLSIGTGIAAGIILDGKLYRGAHGMAGEIGHIIVEPNGELCPCGQRGCLETVAAGPAIGRFAAQTITPHEDGTPTSATVYQLAAQGHPAAQQIVQNVSQHLSRIIQTLILAYDVEKLVLGGGVSQSGNAFLEPILQELARSQAQSELAEVMFNPDKIMLLPTGYNAGLWGAIMLAQTGTISHLEAV